MPYKVALIGLGRIASTIDDEVQDSPGLLLPYAHMGAYRKVSDVEVVAAVDLYPEQREAFRQRWGVERMYADYHEMLAKEKPDIVSVTTSTKPRPGIVLDCARAGVRVIFAEKPISNSLREADAMIATCHEHGAKLAVGCFGRWHPYYTRAREVIDEGSIGRVLHVTAYSRSRISHNGSHLIDLVRFMAGGDARWVMGEMESDEAAATDDDLMGNGYVAFDNGARAYIHMMPDGDSEWVGAMDVIGDAGKLRFFASAREIDLWQIDQTSRRHELVRHLFPTPQVVEAGNVRAVRDFVRCIETGEEPACRGEDARAALEIAIAMRESHRQGGRRVSLPLADRSLQIRSWETLTGDLPKALQRRASVTGSSD